MRDPKTLYRFALGILLIAGVVALVGASAGWSRLFAISISVAAIALPISIHGQTRLIFGALKRAAGKPGVATASTDPNLERKLNQLIATSTDLASGFQLQQRNANEIRRESRALRLAISQAKSSSGPRG